MRLRLTPDEMADEINGLLAFPVTPFGQDGSLNLPLLRQQIEMLLSYGARAVFPACGTGEMQSLSMEEFRLVVRASVEQVDGRVPVMTGIGFGHGIASQMALCAQENGADGLLVFPPYLSKFSSESFVEYYRHIASLVGLGVMIYQRDAAVFSSRTVARLAEIPNVFAVKDGTGRIELLQKQRVAVEGSGLVFTNGVPTAELLAPSLWNCGITSYSSALLNFVPELAVAFYDALSRHDDEAVERLLGQFVVPFVEVRDRVSGYAVSLVKAGVRLRGTAVGSVRSPLPEPDPEDIGDLTSLLDAVGLRHPVPSGRSHNGTAPVLTSAAEARPRADRPAEVAG